MIKVEINNFRQYIMGKITQTKLDRKATKEDIVNGKKKGLDNFQKEYYIGRLQCLQELYDDCKEHEWKLTVNKQNENK